MDKKTADYIRLLAEKYETADFLKDDPSLFMHKVEGAADMEVMAFAASCLSYGSRKQFFPKIQYMLDRSGGRMDEWVRSGSFADDIPDEDRCYYRLYTQHDMHLLLQTLRAMLTEHGSLGQFVRANATDGYGAVSALCAYFAERNSSTVIPRDTKSACKRVCMFMRWMVRDGSPVDLGLWTRFIDKRTLIMPLDTHVVQQSQRLGLLTSRTASMSAARRLSQAMLEVFPDDPLKGDFALFGYGVNNKGDQPT